MVTYDIEIMADIMPYLKSRGIAILMHEPIGTSIPYTMSYRGRFVYMMVQKDSDRLEPMELMNLEALMESGAVGGIVKTPADALSILDEVDRQIEREAYMWSQTRRH